MIDINECSKEMQNFVNKALPEEYRSQTFVKDEVIKPLDLLMDSFFAEYNDSLPKQDGGKIVMELADSDREKIIGMLKDENKDFYQDVYNLQGISN